MSDSELAASPQSSENSHRDVLLHLRNFGVQRHIDDEAAAAGIFWKCDIPQIFVPQMNPWDASSL